ncbi:hypothetical protein [Pseudooceanicola sp. LIPI14-2-Ac024]|uniref:hypothetical protein n=1 Tax=Pseudooceanicola sp. LIPI14-2-Ac024 TaxID=3344875 RepID=UPI0035D12102
MSTNDKALFGAIGDVLEEVRQEMLGKFSQSNAKTTEALQRLENSLPNSLPNSQLKEILIRQLESRKKAVMQLCSDFLDQPAAVSDNAPELLHRSISNE